MSPTTIRKIRLNLRMTQVQFAQAVGAGRVSVSLWENGKSKPRPVYLRQIEAMRDKIKEE